MARLLRWSVLQTFRFLYALQLESMTSRCLPTADHAGSGDRVAPQRARQVIAAAAAIIGGEMQITTGPAQAAERGREITRRIGCLTHVDRRQCVIGYPQVDLGVGQEASAGDDEGVPFRLRQGQPRYRYRRQRYRRLAAHDRLGISPGRRQIGSAAVVAIARPDPEAVTVACL